MSSSTSSSDPAPRGPYVKVLLAILLGMGASLGVVRAFMVSMDASAETILDRGTQALAALPRIVAEERDLMMLYGSSMTEAGFSPRQFDRQMGERGVEVKSFNFGFGGLNPYFQDYMARRVRDAFVESDRRLKLALIEFTPLQNTETRWQGALPVVDSYVAMLADGDDVWEIARQDLTRGIRVAEIKYLRGGVSAEMTTWFFGSELFGDFARPDAGVPADEAKDAILKETGDRLNASFEADYPDYEDCDWCWDWQGGGTIPEERSPEIVELLAQYHDALRSDQRLADDRARRIRDADIEELRLEETLLAALIRTVETFKEFSDHVEVVLLPVNHDWIHRPPEAEARVRSVIERIERETGVTVRNFEAVPEITPDLFSDTTHLSRYAGDVAFTRLLVDTYAPLIGAESDLYF